MTTTNQEPKNAADEWKYDLNGKKYRVVNGRVEYAVEVQTSAGTFYADELPEFNARFAEQKKEYYRKQREAIAALPQEDCPFKIAKGGIHTSCDPECVFFQDKACMIARNMKPSRDTEGRYCPICRICRKSCAMYDGGCKLVCFFKGLNIGKDE